MDKLKMQTPNLIDKNIEQIATLFPNVITETKDEEGNSKRAVDFDMLKQLLSDVLVDDEDERYRLDWPGKKASLLKANTPINKTLRPCRDESVDFDTTENVYIEGDNFEVLKILQESYLGKIKMIYIDPPYNTGNDFIYKDDFKITKDEYDVEIGAVDEDGEKLFRNTDSNGRFHSDWLSMMYERLVVARDLLKDDGVVFVSIDDGEFDNVKKICNEIFGEDNFLAVFIWEKRTSRENRKVFSVNHDYIVGFAKDRIEFQIDRGYLPYTDDVLARYKNPDNDPRGLWQSVSLSVQGGHGTKTQFYDIKTPSGRIIKTPSGLCWRFTKSRLNELIEDNRIWFGKNGDNVPRLKLFISEVVQGLTPHTLWLADEVGTTDSGKREINTVFDGVSVFETPKSVALLKRFLQVSSSDSNFITLDFFSGSATTAHAVMQLNAEDNGNRKFIMIQLPEKADEGSEAYKSGYKTISEIGKERIRRAGKEIKDELKEKSKQLKLGEESIDTERLDIGFRVYRTDSTNMKDVYYHPENLQHEQLSFLESNIKEDRTPDDLLTQVILDLGLELNLPIDKKDILGQTIFIVQSNALIACFDDNINFKIVDEIAELKPFKVVFKDASFKDDKDRINVEERFKRLSPETIISVI